VCWSVFMAHAVASVIYGRHYGVFLLCVDLLWCQKSQNRGCACALSPDTAWQNQWQNHTHATEFLIWSFCTSVNAYGCIWSSFVAVCIGDFERPVSCDNSLRDFDGDASNSVLVLCNVSAERMCECSLLLL